MRRQRQRRLQMRAALRINSNQRLRFLGGAHRHCAAPPVVRPQLWGVREPVGAGATARRQAQAAAKSEKDAKLAQKLGQLQPFIAVFLQECTGYLAYFGST